MPELTVDMFVSLDGCAAGQDRGQGFTIGQGGTEIARLVQQVMDEPQTMVMGRITYEEMASFWASGTDAIAQRMNTLPKLVFSRTLVEPLIWDNARLAKRDLAEEISALKREPGNPLRCIGSISLAKDMMALGLVDRLRLVVFPQILGKRCRRSMFDGYGERSLRLARTSVLDSNILMLEYHPS